MKAKVTTATQGRQEAIALGLTSDEYDLIVSQMGREPTETELGMYSVMWSEHCGYKYSRPILAYFKQYKEALEAGGMENDDFTASKLETNSSSKINPA